MTIRCFLLEPTDRQVIRLRRYVSASHTSCPKGYHDASSDVVATVPTAWRETERGRVCSEPEFMEPPHEDPRWPTHCACGYAFTEADTWQVFTSLIWRRTDTGKEMTLRDAPAGAIWDAWWFHGDPRWTGPDGLALMCKTPGGEWHIDGRASNCTRKDDDVHKCWVREGTPPDLTVGKGGNTCSAGAGSIQAGSYHGFLRGGHLVQA